MAWDALRSLLALVVFGAPGIAWAAALLPGERALAWVGVGMPLGIALLVLGLYAGLHVPGIGLTGLSVWTFALVLTALGAATFFARRRRARS